MSLKSDLEKICSNVQMDKDILDAKSKIDFFSEYISSNEDIKQTYKAILYPENISELFRLSISKEGAYG